jgi:hypothetical protein
MTTFKENALFRGLRAHHQYNACVGNNGGPYDLYDYAQGYFEATGILLLQAMKPGMLIDILVYPICLSFRHAVELYIKYLISDLAKVSGAKENFRKNHSLEDNWKIALKMIRNSALRTTMKQRAKMQEIVESIAEVDQTGEVFRYPESIKEDQHLKNWSVINLVVLLAEYEAAYEIAKTWHHMLEALRDR